MNNLINKELQDLILPPAVEGFNTTLYLALVLGLVLISLSAWRWRKNHHRASAMAQKKLRSLLQAFHDQPHRQPQQTALKTVTLLCQGLGVRRLDQYRSHDPKKWQVFHQQLNQLCYSSPSYQSDKTDQAHKKHLTENNIEQLLAQALVWLNDDSHD